MDNHHALIIFYPTDSGAPRKNKWVIVAGKESGLQCVKPARHNGEHFIGGDGLRVSGVEWWANMPTHPANKSRRW